MTQRFARCLYVYWVLLQSSCTSVIDFGKCTFETDDCGWTKRLSSKFPWTRVSAETTTIVPDAPTADYTFGTRQGAFLYASASSPNSSRRATIIESEPLHPEDGVCGVRLAHAAGRSRLVVRLDDRMLAELRSVYRAWTVSAIAFAIATQSVLSVELEVEEGKTDGFAALDNIQFLPCARCTFELGLCGWASVDGDVTWSVNRGSTPSPGTGPSSDNTVETLYGHYLVAEALGNAHKEARLISPWINVDDNICSIQLFTHTYGKDMGELELDVVLPDGKVAQNWILVNVDQGNRWIFRERRVVLSSSMTKYRYEFKAIIGSGIKSDMAIDDIEFLPCADTVKCSFGQDMCSWNYGYNPSRRVQWKLKPRSRPNEVIISYRNRLVANFTSDSIPVNESAAVEGRLLETSDEICSLQVEYEMTGAFTSMSTLLVRVYPTSRFGRSNDVLLSRRGDSQPVGISEVTISTPSYRYVFIESRRHAMEKGAYVIHSLRYLSCFYSTFDENPRRDLWKDTSRRGVGAQWVRNLAGVCVHQHCLPESDHTYGSAQPGRYYLAHGQGSAQLTRSDVPGSYCGVRFWYYAVGTPRLRVKVSGSRTPIDVAISSDMGSWMPSEVTFRFSNPSKNQVTFIASDLDDRSSLAIDDIELTPCPDAKVCTFETGLCSWSPGDDSDSAEWIRWRGTAYEKTLTDYTKKTPNGHYLLFAPLKQTNGRHDASLNGVPIDLTSNVCGVGFRYVLDPNCNDSLLWVSMVYSTQTFVIWASKAGKELSWQYARLLFRLSLNSTSHAQFRARTNGQCIVAIDNVNYVLCSELQQPELIPLLDQSLATLPAEPRFPTSDSEVPTPTLGLEIESSSVGVIAGSVIGGILFLALVAGAFAAVFWRTRRQRLQLHTNETSPSGTRLDNPNYGTRNIPSVVPQPVYATPIGSSQVASPSRSNNSVDPPSLRHDYEELNRNGVAPPSSYTLPSQCSVRSPELISPPRDSGSNNAVAANSRERTLTKENPNLYEDSTVDYEPMEPHQS